MMQAFLEIAIAVAIVIVISPVFGRYIANVFQGNGSLLDPVMSPCERLIFVAAGVRPSQNMNGKQYLRSLLFTNLLMGGLVFSLLVFQRHLPLNPMKIVGMRWDLALHTTISFLTNTGQQHYLPERAVSYLSQTSAIAFLMFTSAATGLAVGIACIRGFAGQSLGNFYVDLTKGITRVLLPLAVIGAIALLILGVPETLLSTLQVTTLEGGNQFIARGPVASFESIKLLGENGGGFFAANSAHPYENPSSLSNFCELLMMLAIPSALIHTYGAIAQNRKQAKLLFGLVLSLFVALVIFTVIGEAQGNSLINARIGVEQPSLEGKEVRFGWVDSAIWAVTTTTTMTGAVNSMHDSLMPMAGFSTLVSMLMRMIWGGQGLGIAYLLIFAILTAFFANLLAGRTPEFLGRKVEKQEITLIAVILLTQPIAVLIPSALVLAFPPALVGITNPGFHGLSQIITEYASSAANNGSGLEGLRDNTLWWNLSTSLSILLGRYVPIITLILLAERMGKKSEQAITGVTLSTDTPQFGLFMATLTIVLSLLAFVPILALGPVAEGFKLASGIR